MRPRLAEILRCPVDRGPLELVSWTTSGEHIETGLLLNTRRKLAYPIFGGVPRMLVFEVAVTRAFLEAHGSQLRQEYPEYRTPQGAGMPGEEDVLRTFSSEWVNYDWDGQSYWNLDPQAWFRCMRYYLDVEHRPVKDKLVLEVGTGIGGVADYVSRSEGAELVGMDLGHAIDVAYRHFGDNPGLHLVQASAFNPPFADDTFDVVYSFGVIHHTFSTRVAFDRLCRLPKVDGRLNIWVYSPHDEERTFVRRRLMEMERAIRPWAWRLPEKWQSVALTPLIPLYMGYQAMRAAREPDGQIQYGWREAMHAARDRFTPRYIHRHSNEEVSTWFKQAGYEDLQVAGHRSRPADVPIAFTANTGIDGIRRV